LNYLKTQKTVAPLVAQASSEVVMSQLGATKTVIFTELCNALGQELKAEVGSPIYNFVMNLTETVVDYSTEKARLGKENKVMADALQKIVDIELQEFGGDWDEIEEAQEIAQTALNEIAARQKAEVTKPN